MNINDVIQDRIDKYIQGKMTEEEKHLFESDLSTDMELKNKYESQKEIAEAVQKVHLKNVLMKTEEEIRSSMGELSESIAAFALVDKKENDSSHQQTVRNNFIVARWLKPITSIAAAVIVIVFVGFNIYRTSMVKGLGNECYSQMSAPVSRSDSQIEINMLAIYTQIGSGEYDKAKQNIQATYDMLSEMRIESESMSGEEKEYLCQIMLILQQDLEWYDVVLNMKQGKFRQAKKQLKAIANGDGKYNLEASKTLEKIK